MPSQKENISKEELKEVTEWMFENYPPKNFARAARMNGKDGMNMMQKQGMGRNRSAFMDIDLNKDDYITKGELLKVRKQKQEARAKEGMMMRNASKAPSFESMDSNGDGKISLQEFRAFRQSRMMK